MAQYTYSTTADGRHSTSRMTAPVELLTRYTTADTVAEIDIRE